MRWRLAQFAALVSKRIVALQMNANDDAHKLAWIPMPLPPNVRIIVSTLPEEHGCLEALRSRTPAPQELEVTFFFGRGRGNGEGQGLS